MSNKVRQFASKVKGVWKSLYNNKLKEFNSSLRKNIEKSSGDLTANVIDTTLQNTVLQVKFQPTTILPKPRIVKKETRMKSASKRTHDNEGDIYPTNVKRLKTDKEEECNVKQAVTNAVNAIKSAAKNTQTTIKARVKLAEQAIKEVKEKKLQEIVKDECSRQSQEEIQLATMEILSNAIMKRIECEILEKVAEAAAEEAAKREADTVSKSLIVVTEFYSKPTINNCDDEYIPVENLEGFSKLNSFKKEVKQIAVVFNAAIIDISADFKTCLKVFDTMVLSMESIEDFFKKNRKFFLNLNVKDQNIPKRIEAGMVPFIAGMGNLRRLSEDVNNQNEKNEKTTPAQLHSFRSCIIKVYELMKLIVPSDEIPYLEKTMNWLENLDTMR